MQLYVPRGLYRLYSTTFRTLSWHRRLRREHPPLRHNVHVQTDAKNVGTTRPPPLTGWCITGPCKSGCTCARTTQDRGSFSTMSTITRTENPVPEIGLDRLHLSATSSGAQISRSKRARQGRSYQPRVASDNVRNWVRFSGILPESTTSTHTVSHTMSGPSRACASRCENFARRTEPALRPCRPCRLL